jgi:hypothetical protein
VETSPPGCARRAEGPERESDALSVVRRIINAIYDGELSTERIEEESCNTGQCGGRLALNNAKDPSHASVMVIYAS